MVTITKSRNYISGDTRGLSCTWTCLENRSLCWSGHVYTTEVFAAPRQVNKTGALHYTLGAWAEPRRLYTTEAFSAPGHVYTTMALAAPGLVLTKGALAAPGRVYTTGALANPGRVYTKGVWAAHGSIKLQKPVLLLDLSTQQVRPVLNPDCVS
jgi:hypothetical protein